MVLTPPAAAPSPPWRRASSPAKARRSLASSLPQIFLNQKRQLSECAPPSSAQFRQFGEDPSCESIAQEMYRCRGLTSPGSVSFGCQGVALIFAMASAIHPWLGGSRHSDLYSSTERPVLVALLRLANPGHGANPVVIELGVVRDGVLHVALRTTLGF